MSKPKIHIVAFDIPYPADYGGAIDVFYKLKALSELDIDITLHCFQYGDRIPAQALEAFCSKVFYYERDMSWRKAMSTKPFIMASRYNKTLIDNLCVDKAPILFEGMHTAMVANHPKLKNRKMALRMHNVEWEYYKHLAKEESNLFKKIYFHFESIRLQNQRNILSKMDKVFTLSNKETELLQNEFNNVEYLPVFHSNQEVTSKEGQGEYILYHGNLDVAENKAAVNFIVSELYQRKQLQLPLIIAGKMNAKAVEAIETIKHVEFRTNLSAEAMEELIANAQIHLLPTFQSTGIKLKLINALYKGRHVLVNPTMVAGTGLSELCAVEDKPQGFVERINQLWETPFSSEEKGKRTSYLQEHFSNSKGAEQLKQWLN